MRRIFGFTAFLVAASLVYELFFPPGGGHGHHLWSGISGFFIAFGFLGCLLLVAFGKGIGKRYLLRDEDYYHDE